MAAQKGDALLLKLESAPSSGTFNSAAGVRTKSLVLNTELVDVTSQDDVSKWRQGLEGAGVKSMSVSGSGVFKDGTISDQVNTAALAQSHLWWQVIVPGLGGFKGAFQITSLQYAGEHQGESTWEITLESVGDITFTAD